MTARPSARWPRATAGFRAQFYGVVDHVTEDGPGSPLVTAGLIDPVHCAWGERPTRIGGRTWERPTLDIADVEPGLGRWFAARRVPKLLVASQTKVVEVVVDETGDLLPSVPVISVEAPVEHLWDLAAALSAPPVTAWVLERTVGSGLSADAVRLSAKLLLRVPLPTDRAAWTAATEALRAGDLDAYAPLACRAYGADDSLIGWWRGSAPVGSPAMNGDDLRTRLATGEPVLMPGVWDAMSARLCTQAGHEVAFLSGYCTSATLLGLPDFGYLTQGEMAEVARRVCRAAPELMVIVDADTGYGNPLNTIRTVELWEAAGATGPVPGGPGLAQEVRPHGGQAGRPRRRTGWPSCRRPSATRTDLHITARTDARAAVEPRRGHRPGHAGPWTSGVDAVFVEAPESLAELEQIAEALPDCVRVANMIETGKTPLLTPGELHDLGFDLIVAPLGGLYAAVEGDPAASTPALAEDGTLRDDLDPLVTFDEFNALVDLDEHYAREDRYRWEPGRG